MAINLHRSVIAGVRRTRLCVQAVIAGLDPAAAHPATVIAGLDPATQGRKRPRAPRWIPRSSRGMTGAATRNPGKAN